MDNRYKGLIWTNHALERLRQRGISQGDAWATWMRPDQSRPGKGSMKGTWIYYRTWGTTRIEVVAKQNEKKEWIVISVWSDPIFPGRKTSSKTSFWGNLVKAIFGTGGGR